MVTYHVSADCIAIVLDRGELACEQDVFAAVSRSLESAGCRPWEEIEAELYTLGGCQLLLARPCPPLRRRLPGKFPRLKRN